MESQKLENILSAALQLSEEERMESVILETGYDQQTREWELIIKYSGDLSDISGFTRVTELQGGFATVIIAEEDIPRLTDSPLIEFIEKPKSFHETINTAITASCILNHRQLAPPDSLGALHGTGIIIACIDSGVDYMHPDFIDENGNSRILFIWDQDGQGIPPKGYHRGAEYSRDQINEALRINSRPQRELLVPHRDTSGHGTSVLGIAASNGRASGRNYIGVAPESSIIVVKLGIAAPAGFPRTIELMQALDYVSRKCVLLGRPVAINLSFGNNYGAHDGESLIEQFIDRIANIGRTTICVGTGNEGTAGTHTGGQLVSGQAEDIYFGISPFETRLSLQIWKQYMDDIDISIITPSGIQVGPLIENSQVVKSMAENMKLVIYYGEPSPYSMSQEIYIDFVNTGYYLQTGLWRVHLEPRQIIDGRFDIWMPGSVMLNALTRFYSPNEQSTLTIPSTAKKVITVGAYNHRDNNYAPFSGRGPVRLLQYTKPDLAAPGVAIMSTTTGGSYGLVTGTSFATPFVTGSAALMMEWGIEKGNDPYLYGEKVKAYLLKGARRSERQTYPNSQWGWGRLCFENSFPNL